MKAIIAAIIVAVIIPASAFATQAGLNYKSNGVWCKSMSGGVGCVPMSGTGYGVAIHKDFVFVYDNETSRRVFTRYQP